MNSISIAGFLVVIAGIIGWIMNIWKIIDSGFVLAEWGGMQVARVIGVFVAPLGAVLGWF
ncbi:hypothetical protein [Serratia sp. JSRIV004]|uniref:hypothetical protein n=1 Tax=Serratia sp. JSRIV004 TaxID=2831895 RepID=UPI001CBC45BD|nr:hypothetical protein [Serratia sp. JSRIV004]UAN58984.1 hypothetical protein KGP21_08030 [Serratia sp. JSRIV004]UAN59613.1 hypothetical protein KGP21_11415 [Serratia sp. JSRIV004]